MMIKPGSASPPNLTTLKHVRIIEDVLKPPTLHTSPHASLYPSFYPDALSGPTDVTPDMDNTVARDPLPCDIQPVACSNEIVAGDNKFMTYNPEADACENEVMTCNPEVDACENEFMTCNPEVDACENEVMTCNPEVDACENEFMTCNPEIDACENELMACNPEVLACFKEIVTDNSVSSCDFTTEIGNDVSANSDVEHADIPTICLTPSYSCSVSIAKIEEEAGILLETFEDAVTPANPPEENIQNTQSTAVSVLFLVHRF